MLRLSCKLLKHILVRMPALVNKVLMRGHCCMGIFILWLVQLLSLAVYTILVTVKITNMTINVCLCSQKEYFFIVTLEIAIKFPSNLAYNVNNNCLTSHKNYPLHLMYVCTLPCKVMTVRSVT